MEWQDTPYTIPLIGIGVGTIVLALYVYRQHRDKPEGRTLLLLMAGVAIWSFIYALELATADLATKVFWAKLKYLGIAVVPASWLVFALQYTGRKKWLTPLNVGLLVVGALAVLITVWTNDFHYLFWTSVSLDESGPFTALPEGPGFWIWATYSYLLFLFGTILMFETYLRSQRLYRRQAGAMLIAALPPWIGNVIFLADLSPFPRLDLTPFAFAITCVACAWGLSRFRLLDILPVARNAVVENMSEAVIVLDAENNIMDINPSAERLISHSASEAIGQPIDQIWTHWSDEFGLPSEKAEISLEIALGEEENERFYGLRTSLQLDSRERLVCKVVVLRDITDRKQAEETLRQSEERYRTLVNSSLTGIYVVQDGKLQFVNERFMEMATFEWDELQEKSGFDLVHPDDRELVSEAVARLMSGEESAGHYEFRTVTKDGDIRWRETLGVVIEYEGKPAIFGNLIDITERKRAEQAITRSKEQWERTFNAVPDLIAILDDKHRIVRVNNAMADKMDITPDEAVGLTCYEHVHGTKEPPTFCPHSKLLVDGKEHTAEVHEKRLGGDFLVTTSPLHDIDGHLIGSVHIARDITVHKQAEEALRESEEKYRNVVENVNVGVLVAQDGKLTFANNAVSDVLGYTRDEVLSSPNPFAYIHPDDQAMVLERHMKRIEGEDVPSLYSYRVVTKDGTVRWIDATGVRINWKNRPATLNFLTDISERMRAEEERKELESHLREAQKMEAIGTLAGGVAHEFNNALVGITGYIELLQMDLLSNEKTDKYLKQMTNSTQRMVHLTNQLLAYARGGKYQPKPITVNILIEDTVSLMRHNMDSAIRIETDLSDDIFSVEADVTQMQMALTAIISNAAEAMDGQGLIQISAKNAVIDEEFAETQPELKPGPHVCLAIMDDGKGMDKETRERIFEPFFTTKFHGRGLGMAAAFGIVKNHDGTIVVDSEVGKGTQVCIHLPVVETRTRKTDELESRSSDGTGTILVIEDEQTVMDVSRLMLEEMGYQILCAETGREAIAIAATFDGDIDLALLDIKLTDMDGSRIYHAITDARPNMKVLVCSGYSLEGPAQEIIDAGAHGFIQKPFTFAALSTKLNEVLGAG